jgi:hypothetical protein
MTAQDHIDAIGAAITELEDAAKEAKHATRRTVLATKALHDALGKAEAAYIANVANDGDNIVAFSGGSNKPTEPDPDEGP